MMPPPTVVQNNGILDEVMKNLEVIKHNYEEVGRMDDEMLRKVRERFQEY
jgi:hypothetical protein